MDDAFINPAMNDSVALCIRSRRTVKDFTGEAVPRDLLAKWTELACWAPTHRMTQPWRFAVLDQAAIARLGIYLQAEPAIAAVPDPAKGAAKLAKLLERLPTLGALIHVVWERAASPEIDLEEHAAASAAVQNLLLAAHADGWAGFWSTNPALGHPLTSAWCGYPVNKFGFLGSIWLGKAKVIPPPLARVPASERVTWL